MTSSKRTRSASELLSNKRHCENNDPSTAATVSARADVLNLLNAATHYAVLQQVCDHLAIDSLVSLSKTCRQLNRQIPGIVRKKRDIDARLKAFVDHPTALRAELGHHNALISGSFALQYFLTETWSDSDLDIFVERGEALDALEMHLLQNEGYTLDQSRGDDDYFAVHRLQVRIYHRHAADGGLSQTAGVGKSEKRAQIQLIGTWGPPIVRILQDFYMTAVLNIITWNKAYCMFPRETLLRRTTYMLKHVDDYFVRLLLKYSGRGFQHKETVSVEGHDVKTGLQRHRRLGDSHTLTVDLQTAGINLRQIVPDSVIECSAFSMTPVKHPEHEAWSNYSIRADKFQHIALDYPVTFSYEGHETWLEFLAGRLHDRADANILCMEPQDRPAWWRGPRRGARQYHEEFHRSTQTFNFHAFQKPKGWRTYNDAVAGWYEQWLAGLSHEQRKLKIEPEIVSRDV